METCGSLTPTGNHHHRHHCHLMEWNKVFEVPCASFGMLLKIKYSTRKQKTHIIGIPKSNEFKLLPVS